MLKIYKIIDNTNGNVYIGKTEQTLNQRLTGHKYDYKIGNNCSSCIILKNGDYDIELIEETEDKSRERYWIENTNCVNKEIPGRTIKEWREDNKDRIKNQCKEYRERNKEQIKVIEHKRLHYQHSWGGDKRYHNNLLMIDPNLFF